MLVVVESGSTKADWILVQKDQEFVVETVGLSPNALSPEDMRVLLEGESALLNVREQVQRLYFYGSGCSGVEVNALMEKVLSDFFPNAQIRVESDLMAGVLACYNGSSQIGCILGTGSNSCYYDGVSIKQIVPSLGFILGDEGSGSYFGKQLLKDFFYGNLPTQIYEAMLAMNLSKEWVIERVYRSPRPSAYIASFAPLLIEYKDLPYCQELIGKGFQTFLDVHVKCFEEYRSCEVNFVGSMAALLEEELREVCLRNEIRIGRVIQRPLGRLVEYHLKGV